jgi:hypothetical protein
LPIVLSNIRDIFQGMTQAGSSTGQGFETFIFSTFRTKCRQIDGKKTIPPAIFSWTRREKFYISCSRPHPIHVLLPSKTHKNASTLYHTKTTPFLISISKIQRLHFLIIHTINFKASNKPYNQLCAPQTSISSRLHETRLRNDFRAF